MRDDDSPEALRRRLQEVEDAYRATFDQRAVGVAHVDLDGRFFRVNHRLGELFGYAREELLGRSFVEFTHPDDVALSLAVLEDLKFGKVDRAVFEKRYVHRNGSVLWCQLTVSPHRDGEGRAKYFVAVTVDVTAYRLLEAELRETQAQVKRQLAELEHIYDNSPLGLCLMDRDLRFVRINQALADINGPPVSAHIGRTLSEVIPDLAPQIEPVYRKVVQTGRPAIGFEVHAHSPADPTVEKDWLVSYYPVDTDDGTLLGVGTVVLDITDRKRAERTAIDAERRLAERERQAKEQLETDLAEARDELVRKSHLAAIGQVSASIAHELRNPLGSVRNAVFLMKRSPARPGAAERRKHYLDVIEAEVARADRVISNLLAATGRHETRKYRVDLMEVIRAALGTTPGTRRLGVKIELETEPFFVLADKTQLQQVIHNLVTNAIDATGGRGELVIRAERGPRDVTITFSDNGPGIEKELRERIFEPLVTSRTSGTGLGLTICRQIVEQHRGRIEVVDGETPGAHFRITLPA